MATILYIDDEESIGWLISRYFERRGDVVFLAQSIAEAQALLRTENPDVIFLDVWLGQESGFELMTWIDDELPALSTRVTFVTGELIDPTDEGSVWATLGHPCIQKPFHLTALGKIVDQAEMREHT